MHEKGQQPRKFLRMHKTCRSGHFIARLEAETVRAGQQAIGGSSPFEFVGRVLLNSR